MDLPPTPPSGKAAPRPRMSNSVDARPTCGLYCPTQKGSSQPSHVLQLRLDPARRTVRETFGDFPTRRRRSYRRPGVFAFRHGGLLPPRPVLLLVGAGNYLLPYQSLGNIPEERIAVRAPPTVEMSASLSHHGPNCPGKTQNPQASGSASLSPDQGVFLGWAP